MWWCAPSSGGHGSRNHGSTPQVTLRPPPHADGCCIARRTWRASTERPVGWSNDDFGRVFGGG
eukprot:scaffold44468_cov45-Phaeocystis_antarctica.AAC.1